MRQMISSSTPTEPPRMACQDLLVGLEPLAGLRIERFMSTTFTER